MHDQLLTTEEENLCNAVDRLNSFTYPRRRPVIIHGIKNQSPVGYYGHSREHHNWKNFLNRHLHGSQSVFRYFDKKHNNEVRETSSRSLGREVSRTVHKNKQFERRPSQLPMLPQKEVARILSTVKDSPDKPFSSYVTTDHLPSIPTAGHKSSMVAENRLKALLSEDEHSETPAIKAKTSQGSTKYVDLMLYPEKKRLHDTETFKEKKKTPSSLKFDVDPNDEDVFKHIAIDNETEETINRSIQFKEQGKPVAIVTLPGPPPNSRPDSECLAPTKLPEIVLEAVEIEEQNDSDIHSPGDLSGALEQLVHAHNEYEQLKNDLNEIVDPSTKDY